MAVPAPLTPLSILIAGWYIPKWVDEKLIPIPEGQPRTKTRRALVSLSQVAVVILGFIALEADRMYGIGIIDACAVVFLIAAVVVGFGKFLMYLKG